MSGRTEIQHEVESEIVRGKHGPQRVYVRLYEVKTITSGNGATDVETTTRRLMDAWTCRPGKSDFDEGDAAHPLSPNALGHGGPRYGSPAIDKRAMKAFIWKHTWPVSDADRAWGGLLIVAEDVDNARHIWGEVFGDASAADDEPDITLELARDAFPFALPFPDAGVS